MEPVGAVGPVGPVEPVGQDNFQLFENKPNSVFIDLGFVNCRVREFHTKPPKINPTLGNRGTRGKKKFSALLKINKLILMKHIEDSLIR